MRYLLVKEKGKNNYTLYCPDTFGISTWGDSYHQTSLEKKKKYWYISSWSAGNEWIDDEKYDSKLNVVLETTDLDEVLRYAISKNVDRTVIEYLLVEAQNIYNEYIEFQKFYFKNY